MKLKRKITKFKKKTVHLTELVSLHYKISQRTVTFILSIFRWVKYFYETQRKHVCMQCNILTV